MSDSSSTSNSDARRFAVRTLALLAGVALGCALVHRADRLSDVDVVGEKLAAFRQHAGDYDVVFVGSSYVYREISPSEFDSVVGESGKTVRSFNFGVPGMDPPETYFLVDRILDAAPARLRYVVVELDYFRTDVRDRNVHTRRFDYWHDSRRMSEVARGLADSDAGVRWRGKELAFHLEAFAREAFAVGRGRALMGVGTASDATVPESLGPNGDGFRSLDDESARRFDVRRGFYEAFEEDRYEEKLAQLRRGGDAEDASEAAAAVDLRALRSTVARLRERGIMCVLVVPPCLAPRADLVDGVAAARIAPVLAFNSPDAYPALYDAKYRFDVGHLNADGAAVFTRVLAERFAALLTD